MKITLSILQFIALFAGTFVGILAIIGTTRDTDNNLTVASKISIGLLLTTLLVGVVVQVLQGISENREAEEAQQHMQTQMALQTETLRDVRRAMTQIDGLHIDVKAELTDENPYIKSAMESYRATEIQFDNPRNHSFYFSGEVEGPRIEKGLRECSWSFRVFDPKITRIEDVLAWPSTVEITGLHVGADIRTDDLLYSPLHFHWETETKKIYAYWNDMKIQYLKLDETVRSMADFQGKTVVAIPSFKHEHEVKTWLRYVNFRAKTGETLTVDKFDRKQTEDNAFMIATIPADAKWR